MHNIYLDKIHFQIPRVRIHGEQVERGARAGGGAQTAPPWRPPSHNQLSEMSEPQRRRWPLQTGGRPGNSNTWRCRICVLLFFLFFFFLNRRYNGEYYKWHVLPHGSRDALHPTVGPSWKSARADEGSHKIKKKNTKRLTLTFIVWKENALPKGLILAQ